MYHLPGMNDFNNTSLDIIIYGCLGFPKLYKRNDRLHGMPNVLGVMCEMNERKSFKNCSPEFAINFRQIVEICMINIEACLNYNFQVWTIKSFSGK